IKAGAFDTLGHPRRGLLAVFEQIIEQSLNRRREREQGVMSLFGDVVDTSGAAVFDERTVIPDLEFDKRQRLAFEKEMLGLYVSEHPLMGARRTLTRLAECTIGELVEMDDGALRTVAGIVTGVQRKYTKRGDLMATFTFEDLSGAVDGMVFPKTMLTVGNRLTDDAIAVVKGRLDKREDTPKLIVMELTIPELFGDSGPPVRVQVRAAGFDERRVNRLKDLLVAHRGDCPVFIHLVGQDSETVLRLDDEFNCDGSASLCAELRVAFGTESVK
ncbi:MAG TPA: OB-fold nucleic acid binding domain-containing protein, partial [Acidimicrobiia bacterium]